MKFQLFKECKGNYTGVFIPIEEWNALSKENETLQKILSIENSSLPKTFELSDKQISQLDEAINAPKERFLNLTQLKENLENKYGVSL
ncbi:MAG: hypothetical protein LCH67_13445 [Bacteroidetes bacterium]|nr:hypothetical protein [Bacteroidota bacterium]